MPSRLLPIRQWPHGNSCTWAHDVRTMSYSMVNYVPKCMSYHGTIGGLVFRTVIVSSSFILKGLDILIGLSIWPLRGYNWNKTKSFWRNSSFSSFRNRKSKDSILLSIFKDFIFKSTVLKIISLIHSWPMFPFDSP